MLRPGHWEPVCCSARIKGLFVHREWLIYNSLAEYWRQALVAGRRQMTRPRQLLLKASRDTATEVRPEASRDGTRGHWGKTRAHPQTSAVDLQNTGVSIHTTISQCFTSVGLLISCPVWAHCCDIYIAVRSHHELATRSLPPISPLKYIFQITAFCIVCWVCRTNFTLLLNNFLARTWGWYFTSHLDPGTRCILHLLYPSLPHCMADVL
jgi:hypothetical protein